MEGKFGQRQNAELRFFHAFLMPGASWRSGRAGYVTLHSCTLYRHQLAGGGALCVSQHVHVRPAGLEAAATSAGAWPPRLDQLKHDETGV